ncbi:hypothetical protein [Aeromonas eucrenophila]|uniref:Uncharacterized protein n=1 Tax=Aeromonas eucrenophila TaxID=649 RepID=A0ABW0Y8X9_9GAMM|nr:hypothetical protein [Aeromonas eucrenophila]
MAKEKYRLIGHDDLDVLYFMALLGKDELDNLFLNEIDKSPKINNHGLSNQLKPNIIQFVTVDDIELIFNFHQYLQKKLTTKIKNYQHKENAFQNTFEHLMALSENNENLPIDTSVIKDIAVQLRSLIHPSPQNVNFLGIIIGKHIGSKLDIFQMTNDINASARDIATRLISFANEVYQYPDRSTLVGTSTEFLSHLADILLINIPQGITEQWLKFEENAQHHPEKNTTDDMFMAIRTQISMDFGSYHHIVKTFLTATYLILLHIEEIFPIKERSRTLSPDEYIFFTHNRRTFGEGKTNKLMSIPIYYRNITYKIWLYYWQHSQPKFKNATTDATDELYVTGPEMIMALAEAFPYTRMEFDGNSISDELASRRNLISDIYKYPSLVDHYFNHEG